MMFELTISWFVFFFFSFGFLGLNFVLKKKAAKKPWRLRINENYTPKVSILVPTYNESSTIALKLENLSKIEYPKDMTQIIVVDSKSDDHTIEIANNFAMQHPEMKIKVLVENERRGKSAALNLALKNCDGDVVVVSDADCFWPPSILGKALPFLADPDVGAISGQKILLNPKQSWVTETEDAFLSLMNLMRLGESKVGSTLFFEGGFSAYKRGVLGSFDPYNTGSDDCGTVITLAEKKLRSLFVPAARFYTAFPTSWKERVSMKVRRANQIVRVLWKYFSLLLRRRITGQKGIILQNVLAYVFGPAIFVALAATTFLLLLSFPYFALVFTIFLIPPIRSLLTEVIQNYLVLFFSILSMAFNKKFVVWNKPADRALLEEQILRQYGLI